MKMSQTMIGKNWFSDIVKSIANIPPAINHYETELEDARREVALVPKWVTHVESGFLKL